jgi:hypothetical protein
VLNIGAGRADTVEDQKGQQSRRNAARREVKHHAPLHLTRACHLDGAAHFGKRGKQQIGADGHVGLDAKNKDQDGRHQRAAADAGEANHHPDKKTGKNKSNVLHRRQTLSARLYISNYLLMIWICDLGIKEFFNDLTLSKLTFEWGQNFCCYNLRLMIISGA